MASRPTKRPVTREGVALLIEDCEKTSAALSMRPTPFQLEQASNFLVTTVPAALRNLEEQLQIADKAADIAEATANEWRRELERTKEQLEAARSALSLWTACSPAHRAECAFLSERGCTCGLQRARDAAIAVLSGDSIPANNLGTSPAEESGRTEPESSFEAGRMIDHSLRAEGIDYGPDRFSDQPEGWVVTCDCGEQFFHIAPDGARAAWQYHADEEARAASNQDTDPASRQDS